MSLRSLLSCHRARLTSAVLSLGLCLAGATPLVAGTPGDSDARVITIFLPTWSETPQSLQITEPNPKAVAPDPAPEEDASVPTAIAQQGSSGGGDPTAISTQLLMPQEAPPMPDTPQFSPLSPAADIWLQGLAWVVEGQEFEKAGDIPQAIGRFQNARSAYELVELRFPDWQPDIIAFRLGDLERQIRRLVQKTTTPAVNDQPVAVKSNGS